MLHLKGDCSKIIAYPYCNSNTVSNGTNEKSHSTIFKKWNSTITGNNVIMSSVTFLMIKWILKWED
jgi:hypothetical protein